MTGWIRMERDVFDGDLFPKEPMSEREAWLWMTAQAAWEDTTHRIAGQVHEVPRGSFMTTLRELQSVFMWRSDTKVRNFLKRLVEKRMIERTKCGPKNAPKTHVTICDYDENQNAVRTTNARETHEKRTEKRSKETKINKKQTSEAKASSARGARLPDDWALPRDWGEWALAEGWTDDAIRAEADKFKDYWTARTGQGATKRDWLATWRNWMRNSKAPRVFNGGMHDESTHGSRRRETAVEQIARLARLSEA